MRSIEEVSQRDKGTDELRSPQNSPDRVQTLIPRPGQIASLQNLLDGFCDVSIK